MSRLNTWFIITVIILFNFAYLAKAKDAIQPVDPEFLAFFAAIYNDPVERASIRLDDFSTRLAISETQKNEWNAFKDFFLSQFEKRQARLEDFRLEIVERNGKPLTTPESLELRIESLHQEMEDFTQAKSVVEKLYIKLDEQQKLIFDQGMRAIWFRHKMRQKQF